MSGLGALATIGNQGGLAAGGGDFGDGRLAELGGVNFERLRERAVTQDLDAAVVVALDEPLGPQRGLVDDGARVECGVKITEVDDDVFLLESAVEEASLGDAACQ